MSAAPLPKGPPATLQADYFDGVHARAHQVTLRVEKGTLYVEGATVDGERVPVALVRWPERTRHGTRIAQLPSGASLQASDSAAWDAWCRDWGNAEGDAGSGGWVVRAQQSWRLTLLAVLALVLLGVAGYRWGLPLAARGLLAVTPQAVDRQVGQAALASLDGRWLHPSELPAAEQARLRRLMQAAERRVVAVGVPRVAYEVQFRRSSIGPNALALPDGTLVITDELVKLLDGQDEVLIGVFGHELAHVRERHAMRLFVQSGVLAAAASVALGDFSSLLAAAPALLGHLAYSRDFEREADDGAIAILRANGILPSAMTGLFKALAGDRGGRAQDTGGQAEPQTDLGFAFSSHPADAERIQRFLQADRLDAR